MNNTIVIIGSGHMGAGIAAIFSAAGHPVVLLGRDMPRLQMRWPAISALAATLSAAQPTGSLVAADLNAWNDWDGVALVIETISEDLAAKRALFADLDRRVPPHIPIGSNSSGHGIDEMTECLSTTARMLNVHYSMPAHIVPMVEVALGSNTSLPLAEGVCRLIQATGKKTTLIRQYIPGLLITRLQHALMREALSLVDQGIVTPQDIDDAVRFGFGFRFAALGPMAQKEMSGWDTHVASGASVYPSLSNIDTPPACVADLVKQGRTGMKSGAGFAEWTPEAVAAFRQRYDERLQAAYAVLSVAPD
ncbi:3-hydroxyacyl-CoA dehydrogenase NAD-binding domain-containing protein [Hydrogenophaga luteola]|uniref:L-gulonate 3-dehydrogenase n=1 Tax=Hydrogenophaga luteola TaxID=1591122 RepID=A0ABV7W0P7_9BURK